MGGLFASQRSRLVALLLVAVALVVLDGALDHGAAAAVGLREGEAGVLLAERAEQEQWVTGTDRAGKTLRLLRLIHRELGHAELERVVLRDSLRVRHRLRFEPVGGVDAVHEA